MGEVYSTVQYSIDHKRLARQKSRNGFKKKNSCVICYDLACFKRLMYVINLLAF